MLRFKRLRWLFAFLPLSALAIAPMSTDARIADPTLSVVVYEHSSSENNTEFIVNVTNISEIYVEIDQVSVFRLEDNKRTMHRSNALVACNSMRLLSKPKPVAIPLFEQHEFLWDGLSDDCQTPSPGMYHVWLGGLRLGCKKTNCPKSYYFSTGGAFTIK